MNNQEAGREWICALGLEFYEMILAFSHQSGTFLDSMHVAKTIKLCLLMQNVLYMRLCEDGKKSICHVSALVPFVSHLLVPKEGELE